MIRISPLVLVAVLVLSASTANAIELKNRLALSPFIGGVIPVGDFADADVSDGLAPGAKPGFCVGGAIEYGLTENIVIGGRVTFNRFGYDEDAVPSSIPEDVGIDANWTLLEIVGAHMKLLMSAGGTTRPYLRAGVFAGKPKMTLDATSEGESAELEAKIATSIGLEAGVGVMHMLSENVAGFFEGSIAHLQSDGKDGDITINGEDALDAEVAYNIQWITVRGGVTIFLGK